MNEQHRTIIPVILSGGSGQRLWPLSRELYPKQFLPLVSDKTMIQETALRVANHERFADPVVICNAEHRFIVAEQLREKGITPSDILLEERGRNSGPAVVAAALRIHQRDPNALMFMLSSDHVIRDPQAFVETALKAGDVGDKGKFVTIGIRATDPNTGYGYIKQGPAFEGIAGAFSVEQFVEKPDLETAQAYLKDGNYHWNAGIFMFPVDQLLKEVAEYEPEIITACQAALDKGHGDLDFFRLDPDEFDRNPDISIDYALMERTSNAVVVPASCGWNDVGSWGALYEELVEEGKADPAGNVRIGDVITVDTNNVLVHSEDMFTSVVGLDDVVVVVTDDAVLVSSKERAQDVKTVVSQLKQAGRCETKHRTKVYRPWGYYKGIHAGDRFQVKRLSVDPGQKLSLQKHYHRAEHWVVVSGTALVTVDGETKLVRENESIYLPLGCSHRLENPGQMALDIIEVQSGSYLGEDDIVRLEDTYGRT